jgi:hypothetical protein
MSATLLSEDGEARLARLAWRELQRYIAKYPQLELTRASEIAKYLSGTSRWAARQGQRTRCDCATFPIRASPWLSWRGSDLREAQPNQQH